MPDIRDRIVELRRVPAKELTANPKNWRRHPKTQQAALSEMLNKIGYADALLARETPDGLMLIDGHLRAEATPDAIVPVLILDVDEDEADMILATLDPLASMADTDADGLASLLENMEIESDGLSALLKGLAGTATEAEDEPEIRPEDDEVPESAPPFSKPGYIWEIGPHRLIVGDSTEPETFEKLMAGEAADIVWTDPPYGVSYVGKTADAMTIENDSMSLDELEGFLRKALEAASTWTKSGGGWYVASPSGPALLPFAKVLTDLAIWRQGIIWVKDCLAGSTRLYYRAKRGVGVAHLYDLTLLDPSTVELWNGSKWTQVVAWSRARDQAGSKVLLRSGEEVIATENHEWPTQRGLVRTADLVAGDVLQSCQLPDPEDPVCPQWLPDKEVGWVAGLYLAEGNKGTNCRTFTIHRNEVAEFLPRLRSYANALGGTVNVSYRDGERAWLHLFGAAAIAVIDSYIDGNSSHDKRLSNRTWKRTNLFLRALMEGYLDGDGHWDEANKRWRLGFTRNNRLAAHLRTLSARLGGTLRLTPCVVDGFGKKWDAYRGDFRWTPSDHFNARVDTEVMSVTPLSRLQRFWDVEVEDDPHLFALASGVLTHNSFVMGRSDFHYRHEYLFYGWKPGAAHHEPPDRRQDTIWEVPRPKASRAHPTMKPIELVVRSLMMSSNKGDVVLDPFGGSGTTMLAAERSGRVARLIELDPKYADVILRRMQEATGVRPVLAGTGQSFDFTAEFFEAQQEAMAQADETEPEEDAAEEDGFAVERL